MQEPLLTSCIKLTKGSLPAAIILYRLLYWHKWKSNRGHEPVIAKSGAEWVEETGLTQQQVKDGIAKLRELKLIRTEKKRFGTTVRNHFRLVNVGSMDPDHEGLETLTIGSMDTDAVGLQTPTYIQENNQEKLQENDTAAAPAEQSLPEVDLAPKYPTYKKGSSVFAILAESQAKVPLLNAQSVPALLAAWRQEMKDVHGIDVPPFTAKDRANMKLFKEAAGDHPEKKLVQLIANWVEFTLAAGKQAGAFNLPTKPMLSFLAKFRQVAVNMSDAQQSASQPLTGMKKSLAPKASEELNTPAAIAPSVDKAHKSQMTKEELLAILNDEDDD